MGAVCFGKGTRLRHVLYSTTGHRDLLLLSLGSLLHWSSGWIGRKIGAGSRGLRVVLVAWKEGASAIIVGSRGRSHRESVSSGLSMAVSIPESLLPQLGLHVSSVQPQEHQVYLVC